MNEQMKKARNKLCLALDGLNHFDDVIQRVRELKNSIGFFKVGMASYYAHGPQLIEEILKLQVQIFLDLKMFDIPNTVYEAAMRISAQGVSIFNVHAMGGQEMMKAALDGASLGASKAGVPMPKVIGVTILTSMNQIQLQQIQQHENLLPDQVRHLAQETYKSGLHGIVCSAQDLDVVYKDLPKDFFTITPGIQGTQGQIGFDQKRIATPQQALSSGSHLLVIGRAINDQKTALLRQQEAFRIQEIVSQHV